LNFKIIFDSKVSQSKSLIFKNISILIQIFKTCFA
jgi:hypothetical protein